MFKSLKILNDAGFRIEDLNGYDCYKKSNDRYYHCFINQNEIFNSNVKWSRISEDEYKDALKKYNYLSSVNG